MDHYRSLTELADRFAKKMKLLDPSDRADIVQEAMLLVVQWQKHPTPKQTRMSKEELLWNAVKQAKRKHNSRAAARRMTDSKYAEQKPTSNTPGGNSLSSDGNIESWSHLLRLIAELELTPVHLEILRLRKVKRLSYAKIAKKVDLGRWTVMKVCLKYLRGRR